MIFLLVKGLVSLEFVAGEYVAVSTASLYIYDVKNDGAINLETS
jgi:hypothetical protein